MEERLQKVLARAGWGSRRYCEQLIINGRVRVDDQVITELGYKVDLAKNRVWCDGKFVRPEPKVYFLLNKPKGYICTNAPTERKRVIDLFKGVPQRLYSAGRLDADSEGLLVVTNDGALCNQLTHPRYEVPKTYQVTVQGYLDKSAADKIQRGVWLTNPPAKRSSHWRAGGKTSRARLRILKRTRDFTTLEITLKEGRNREVRRIFAKVGHPVKYLQRTRIGKLSLAGLKPGQYKSIGKKELLALIKS